jgi:hypothetical protein
VAGEILASFLTVLIKVTKVSKLQSLDVTPDPSGYKKVIETQGFYDMLTFFVSSSASLIGIVLVFIFFGSIISDAYVIVPQAPKILLLDLMFVFVLFRVLGFLINLIKYFLLKNIDTSSDIPTVINISKNIHKKMDLLQVIPLVPFLYVLLSILNLSIGWVVFFILFMLFLGTISLIEIYRIKTSNLNLESSNRVLPELSFPPDEYLELSVFGLMNQSKTRSLILGGGAISDSENSVLITNKRLLFIEIPTSIDQRKSKEMPFYINRQELTDSGKKLIIEMRLPEIWKSFGVTNIFRDEVASYKIEHGVFTITLKSGFKKLCYV